jgi:glycolate oxidase FAD binding subunit
VSSNGSERPATVDDAAALLRDTRGTVLFRGAGTKLVWAGVVPRTDLTVDTTGLDRLLVHNPADLTAAAQAGMPLAAVQRRLAAAGQWLPIDPPTEAGGATLGGLLATGDSGPRRLRYGALRDLVIGVTLVLADGTIGRSGGQVIKNVAGYDLSRLAYGSLGTLGLIAEIVFRVHPRPAASATVVGPVDAATAAGLTRELSTLEPSAATWADGELAVRFEGPAAGVEAQVIRWRERIVGTRTLTGPAESAGWQSLARQPEPGRSVAFAGTLPSRLPAVADALTRAGDEAAVPVRLTSHTALGLHTAVFGGPAADQARAFAAWRTAVLAIGGTVLLRDRPAEVDGLVDALGPAPSSAPLLRALRSRLDPDGRCAPGRLGRWLIP